MIIDGVMSLKTSAVLLDALQRASVKKLSSKELLEQRVSFVFGSMSNHNDVTKDRVRQVILEQVGGTEATK
ncbi:hypothetical protein [Polaromonas sp. LjRoot131]|uniref:hypothetical protein n=1 Tax=Polaromonas sp. LjRoot131 TaxID=3342262 RepID=UPI003ECFF7FB